MERLQKALELLGYNQGQLPHIRHNLLSAIHVFAAQQNDDALEQACEAEMKALRASVTS